MSLRREGICDEEKVTWYTNVSRIKRKITDKLGKRTAEQYNQHDPTLSLDEHVRISAYHCVDLLGSHRLAILAEMETLTVYHVGDLLGPHSPAG